MFSREAEPAGCVYSPREKERERERERERFIGSQDCAGLGHPKSAGYTVRLETQGNVSIQGQRQFSEKIPTF